MSNNIFYSADYKNDQSLGLFDRIINIKFTRKNGETFTLRSDYEPVWSGGRMYYKVCQPKPEIRVQYTQYQATMIAVEIYITNLNLLENFKSQLSEGQNVTEAVSSIKRTSNQPNEALTRKGNHIEKAEIEMGYRGQFFDWSLHTSDPLNQAKDYESFLNLERPSTGQQAPAISETQRFFRADLRKCVVKIEWATNISNPPDRVTQFHGYVGSTEAGLQPVSLSAINFSTTEEGDTGQITKEEIFSSLNDNYGTIDEVSTVALKDESEGTPLDIVLSSGETARRNFFNGGKGFTLLEGYCFHLITRRFIRSDIAVKNNKTLAKASLDYLLSIEYENGTNPLRVIEETIRQNIYRRERPFFKSYFSSEESDEENMGIKVSSEMPESFFEGLEAEVKETLLVRYVGSRLTVKNLPEHRSLYNAIRQRMTFSAQRGEYKLWWDAAEEIGNQSLGSLKSPYPTKKISDNDAEARQYILDLESGKLNGTDCYFSKLTGTDWILPIQGLEGTEPLKDSKGKTINFVTPTETTSTGFGSAKRTISVKCFSGLLEVRDAYMFGIPVLCSSKASEKFKKRNEGSSFVELQFFPSVQAQVDWICQTWGLQYYKLHNGGYYMYDPAENARDTAGQDFAISNSQRAFRIPAVYDITLSPIRKIRMPFVAFLNPTSIVEWNSKSTIGQMISYYFQPKQGRNFFMVVSNTIDFDTVGDHNTMELALVDSQFADKTEVPAAVIKQEKSYYMETLIIPDNNMDSWEKIYNSPISIIPANLREIWEIRPTIPEKNLSLDNRVSTEQFFLLLSQWNPTLFEASLLAEDGWQWSDWKKRIDKRANKLYGGQRPKRTNFPDISYCLPLFVDNIQRIFTKFPFMPDNSFYSQMVEHDPKYMLVYEKGVWGRELKETMKKRFNILEGS